MDVLQGPDVSSYQKTVDWTAVASSGRQFGWCKATEGTGYINPYFQVNWAGMKAAGLVRGAYHFGRPDLTDPATEASYFLTAIPDLQPGDLIALDLEDYANVDMVAWALGFMSTTTQLAGFAPMFYSGRWFMDPEGLSWDDRLGQYGLWMSGYQDSPPPLPPAWTTLAMWQFTDNSSIPGIAGGVDESYFFGNLAQLLAYGKPGASVAAGPTPQDQAVTCLSVIGDNTYPDGSNIDALADGQAVSHRIFIRQLVQYIKTLPDLPADLITMVSVIGDNTYPANIDEIVPDKGVSHRVFIRELVQQTKALLGA